MQSYAFRALRVLIGWTIVHPVIGLTIASPVVALTIAHPVVAQTPAPAPNPTWSTTAPEAPPPGGDLEHFIRLYETDIEGLERFYGLPGWPDGMQRIRAAEEQWRGRLAGLDFDALGPQGRLDYLLLRNHITARLARLDRQERRLAELDPLLPFRADILRLAAGLRRMERVNPQEAATTLAGFAERIRAVRERVEAGRGAAQTSSATPSASAPAASPAHAADTQPAGSTAPGPTSSAAPSASSASGGAPLAVTPVLARRAAELTQALAGALREWNDQYAGYQPDFAWWIARPHEDAQTALAEYARYLREDVAGLRGKDDDPLIGDPIGPEGLAVDLAEETLAYGPDELIAIGEREMAWCEAELRRAAADMGLGDDWKAALARVKELHVPPGGQDELVADLARGAIRFLRERDLVTIPPLCEETWRIVMMSPETQRVLPFQAYGGQSILVAYPTSGMKHEEKLMSMRGNNRHFTRIAAAHELIPGHHLQAFMAERQRPYRRLFATPFFGEGWCLYWEMTLWDLPFAESAEDRVGMLFWRMHRCARIIVSLRFHLGQMSPQEMVDFLVERVGHERYTATGEVRRYVGDAYSPLYQCGYMIGGLQLRALRREVVDAGRMPEKAFHDRLLTYGPIPIEWIRLEMLNLPTRPDLTAAWRFYGDVP